MGSLLFYAVVALVIAAAIAVIANVRFGTAKDVALPPGPPAEPLIGHLRVIPTTDQAEFYHEMRKRYGEILFAVRNDRSSNLHAGDVLYFHALGRSIVVLNSVEAAVDLLEKRSLIYSDRPPLVMLEDVWVDVLCGLLVFSYRVVSQTRFLPQHLIDEIRQTFPETPQIVSFRVFASANPHLRGQSNRGSSSFSERSHGDTRVVFLVGPKVQ